MNNEGLSAADVIALTKDNNGLGGGNFWWIIVFLIIAGMFGGFGYNNNVNPALGSDEFIKRDIFNTNQNVSNTACTTQRDVLENRYQLGKDVINSNANIGREVMENRYANQLGVQSIISSEKDCCCTTNRNIDSVRYDNALGQANIQKDMLLQGKDFQAQLASCCCDLKTTMHNEGEATRALITQNRIADLEKELNQAQTAIANSVQTRNILDTIGRYSVVSIPYNSYPYGYGVSSVI